jgi:hypothetical protein
MSQETMEPLALAESLQNASIGDTSEPIQYYPQPSSLPKVVSKTIEIRNVIIDIWLQLFVDRVVFGVSQIGGSIGNFLLCEAVSSDWYTQSVDYQVSTLLGAREDALLQVYARRITELIAQETHGPKIVVLGISLHKDIGRDPEMFHMITRILHQMYMEARQ